MDVSPSTSIAGWTNVFLLPFLTDCWDFINVWLTFFLECFLIGSESWCTCLIFKDIICQGCFLTVFLIKIVIKIERLCFSRNLFNIIRLFVFIFIFLHLFFKGQPMVIIRFGCTSSFYDLKKFLISVVSIIIELAYILIRFFSRQVFIFSFIKCLFLRGLITQLGQNVLSEGWSHRVPSWVRVFLPFNIREGMRLVGKEFLCGYLVVSKRLKHLNLWLQLHQLKFFHFFIHF